MSDIIITNWKPMDRNSLRGFLSAQFPSGLIVHEVSVHASNGKVWASPPSKPLIDGTSGNALRDGDGKIRYVPLIAFSDKSLRDRWSKAVVEAVLRVNPNLSKGVAK